MPKPASDHRLDEGGGGGGNGGGHSGGEWGGELSVSGATHSSQHAERESKSMNRERKPFSSQLSCLTEAKDGKKTPPKNI